METFTIFLVKYIADVYISNTTGMPHSCCGNELYSLNIGPGTFQIEYSESLKRLCLYTQKPHSPIMILTNPNSVIKYPASNIMFYADGPGVIKLTILKE
jgi:hypothetical protein